MICIGFTLAVMIVIFYFSSQKGRVSQNLSEDLYYSGFGLFLMKILPSLGYIDLKGAFRKYAHLAEFAVLGFWMMLTVDEYLKDRKSPFVNAGIALLFCFIYGISDEIHQLFVEGRSCQIKDVFIDGFGSLMGILLILLCIFVKRRKSHAGK